MSNNEKMKRIEQLVSELIGVVREKETKYIFVNIDTETNFFNVSATLKNGDSFEFYCSSDGETKQFIRKENV